MSSDPIRSVVAAGVPTAPQSRVAETAAQSGSLVARMQADRTTENNGVEAAVQQIRKYLQDSGRSIDFHFDAESGLPVVTVRDTNTGELIRQLPSEEALRLAQLLKEGNGLQGHATVRLIA